MQEENTRLQEQLKTEIKQYPFSLSLYLNSFNLAQSKPLWKESFNFVLAEANSLMQKHYGGNLMFASFKLIENNDV